MLIVEEKDEDKNQKNDHTTEEVTNIMIESMMADMMPPYCCEARDNRLQKESENILKKRNKSQRNKE